MMYKEAIHFGLERPDGAIVWRRGWPSGRHGKLVGDKLVLSSEYWLTEEDTASDDWMISAARKLEKRRLRHGLRVAAGFLLVFLGAGAAHAACSVPNVFVPNTIISSSAMNANFAAVVNCSNLISSPFASAASALATIPVTAGNVIVNSQILPPATYTAQATACLFSDGGSQIPITAPGGGCWVLSPQGVYDIRWWGLSAPNQFYASPTGNDYNGANFCVVAALPCQTLKQAYVSLKKFNMQGLNDTINLAAGTYQGIPMTGIPPGGGPGTPAGGTLGPLVVINGVGATSIITDNQENFGVMFIDGGISVEFENLEISAPEGDDGLFIAGIGNFVTVGPGFVCNGAVGAALCLHVEGHSRVVVANHVNLELAGNWVAIFGINFFGEAQLNTGSTVTCDNGLTIGSSFITMKAASTAIFVTTFTGCNTVAARNFTISGNSYLDDSLIVWPPLMNMGVLQGGGRHALVDVPCVGGAVGPPACLNVTAPTGWPANSTFAVNANSGLHSGQINITSGATTAVTTGTIWISFPTILETSGTALSGQCTASLGQIHGGGVAWPVGSNAYVIDQNANPNAQNIEILANSNSATLASGSVFSINWQCDGD